jgi:uncharacterized membrane protein
MSTTIQTVEIDRPITTVYDQWTQFEGFPQFMEGVEAVRQIDDTHLQWRAKIAGVTRQWDAEIIRQEPHREIAWQATSGTRNRGAVTFREVGVDRTEVALDLDFEPEGAVEQVGDKLGLVKSRASGDLRRFKEFIESRPVPTGAWSGSVRDGRVVNPS